MALALHWFTQNIIFLSCPATHKFRNPQMYTSRSTFDSALPIFSSISVLIRLSCSVYVVFTCISQRIFVGWLFFPLTRKARCPRFAELRFRSRHLRFEGEIPKETILVCVVEERNKWLHLFGENEGFKLISRDKSGEKMIMAFPSPLTKVSNLPNPNRICCIVRGNFLQWK